MLARIKQSVDRLAMVADELAFALVPVVAV